MLLYSSNIRHFCMELVETAMMVLLVYDISGFIFKKYQHSIKCLCGVVLSNQISIKFSMQCVIFSFYILLNCKLI